MASARLPRVLPTIDATALVAVKPRVLAVDVTAGFGVLYSPVDGRFLFSPVDARLLTEPVQNG